MNLFHKAQWYFNKSLKVEFYSDSFLKIFKGSENQLKDKSFEFLSFIHEEDRGAYQKELEEFYDELMGELSKVFNHNPFRIVVDGQLYYFQEEKSLIKKGSNNFLISSVYYDCTDLYSHLIQQQNLINESFEGTWEWLPKTDEVQFSPRLLKYLGLHEASVEPSLKFWLSLVHPDDGESFISLFQDYLEKGKGRFSTKVRVKKSNSEWASVLLRGAITEKNLSGLPKRVTVSLIDPSLS